MTLNRNSSVRYVTRPSKVSLVYDGTCLFTVVHSNMNVIYVANASLLRTTLKDISTNIWESGRSSVVNVVKLLLTQPTSVTMRKSAQVQTSQFCIMDSATQVHNESCVL